RRFYWHPGIDPLALLRACGQWLLHGRIISGASTLTMQTARLLESIPHTLSGKLWQIGRALQLEWHLDKAEILQLYLQLAPYGG
ncbi:MAG: transglycosylase domain-containing protein, partial [Candidatus Competibacteraceae bacterium]|nr:transglycosylase domain-containing protein [Candidatus Competibacteraceae bacterium]